MVFKKIDLTIYDFLDIKYSNITETILVKSKPLYAIILDFGHLSVKIKN